jgi:Protein of unknown function (DUF2505)
MAVEYEFSASPHVVYRKLCDADFLVDRCLTIGDFSADCTVEDDDEQVVVAMTRVVENALPPFLARLLEPRQTLDQVERWRPVGDARHGRLQIRIVGQPVSVEADMRLQPNASGGCTYSVEHTVTANMPLIGRRVENYLLMHMEKSARAELAYLDRALMR